MVRQRKSCRSQIVPSFLRGDAECVSVGPWNADGSVREFVAQKVFVNRIGVRESVASAVAVTLAQQLAAIERDPARPVHGEGRLPGSGELLVCTVEGQTRLATC